MKPFALLDIALRDLRLREDLPDENGYRKGYKDAVKDMENIIYRFKKPLQIIDYHFEEILCNIKLYEYTNLGNAKDCSSEIVKDIDGNNYHTVKIGNQVWTVENLKTTKYNDGVPISEVTNDEWGGLKTPAYCWYNNDIKNKEPYGALYNWYAVDTGKLASAGWHIPTDDEWTILENYLGGRKIAGEKLKEVGAAHWPFLNGSTDEVGFTALPGGYRGFSGYFSTISGFGYWWSATEGSASGAYNRYLYYDHKSLDRLNGYKSCGFSVRLLRD